MNVHQVLTLEKQFLIPRWGLNLQPSYVWWDALTIKLCHTNICQLAPELAIWVLVAQWLEIDKCSSIIQCNFLSCLCAILRMKSTLQKGYINFHFYCMTIFWDLTQSLPWKKWAELKESYPGTGKPEGGATGPNFFSKCNVETTMF